MQNFIHSKSSRERWLPLVSPSSVGVLGGGWQSLPYLECSAGSNQQLMTGHPTWHFCLLEFYFCKPFKALKRSHPQVLPASYFYSITFLDGPPSQVFLFRVLTFILHSAICFAVSFSWVAKCPFLFKNFLSSEQGILFLPGQIMWEMNEISPWVVGICCFLRDESNYTESDCSHARHPCHVCALLGHENVPKITIWNNSKASFKEMCREICFKKEREHLLCF